MFWIGDAANLLRLAMDLAEKVVLLAEIRWSEAARLPMVRVHAETIRSPIGAGENSH